MNDRVLPAAPFTTPMPKVQPPKASYADRVEEAVRYAREGGAGFDTDVERNIAELGARRAISMFVREEGFYDPSFSSSAPDTITLGQTLALVRERLEGVLRTPHYAEEVLTLAIADIDRVIGKEGAAS